MLWLSKDTRLVSTLAILFLQTTDKAVAGERSTLPPANVPLPSPKAQHSPPCQPLISGLKLPTRMPISANVAGVNVHTQAHNTEQAEKPMVCF